jgi:hypothetical protein
MILERDGLLEEDVAHLVDDRAWTNMAVTGEDLASPAVDGVRVGRVGCHAVGNHHCTKRRIWEQEELSAPAMTQPG